MKRSNISEHCNNCNGRDATSLKGFDQPWKAHVITLCDDHLVSYKDATNCLYRRAMGLSGAPAWTNGYWAQLYADRLAYIEAQISGAEALKTGADSPPRKKRQQEVAKETNSQGTQTDGPPNPDLGELGGMHCDEILVPDEPEGEGTDDAVPWTEQDPDQALKAWEENLKPRKEKKAKSKYVFFG